MLAVGVFAVANLERGTPVAITICVAAAHGGTVVRLALPLP
jgi:hypothetical protein